MSGDTIRQQEELEGLKQNHVARRIASWVGQAPAFASLIERHPAAARLRATMRLLAVKHRLSAEETAKAAGCLLTTLRARYSRSDGDLGR